MIRTTLDIDEGVLRELRARSDREGRPLGALVSELLAHALWQPPEPPVPAFEWITSDMGPARIDLDDHEAVLDVLEER